MDELAKIYLTKMPSSLVGEEWQGSDISLNSVPGLKEINAQKVILMPASESPDIGQIPVAVSGGSACGEGSGSSYSRTFCSPNHQSHLEFSGS